MDVFLIRGIGTISSGGDCSANTRLLFPHRGGQYGPGGPPFSSPVSRSCECMEAFVISGWVALALHTPGWSFYTVLGGVQPGDHRFRPRFARVVDVWKDF